MLTPAEMLEHFKTRRANVFALGCLDQRITMHSQQVRALNLVYALEGEKRIWPGANVIVIGAGVGGLTAAAAAARLNCNVTVLERALHPIPLQRNSSDRFIHPHAWDWPDVEAMTEDAELPLLTWSADSAREVAKEIWQQFEVEKQASGGRLRCLTDVSDIHLTPGDPARVSYFHGRAHPATTPDALILAVGFGLEPNFYEFGGTRIKSYSYWHPHDPSWSADSRSRRFLVSGAGDSGLIEVLRLRLLHFDMKSQQTEWLHSKLLAGDENKQLTEFLLAAERTALAERAAGKDHATGLERVYNDVIVKFPGVVAKLHEQLRPDTAVVLSSLDNPWPNLKSSPLNRLLVGILVYSVGGGVRLNYSPIDSVVVDPHLQRYEVQFGGTLAEHFDDVIVRHGPQKPRPLPAGGPDGRPIVLHPFLSAAEVEQLRNDARHDQTRKPSYEGLLGKGRRGPNRERRLEEWSREFAARAEQYTNWTVCGDAIELPVSLPANGVVPAHVTVPYDKDLDEVRVVDVFDEARAALVLDSLHGRWLSGYSDEAAWSLSRELLSYARTAPAGRLEKCKLGFSGFDFGASGSPSLKVRPINHLVTEHFNRTLAMGRFSGDKQADAIWSSCLEKFLKPAQNHHMPCPSQLFIELSLTTADGLVPIVRKNATTSVYARRFGQRVRTCGPELGPAWTKVVSQPAGAEVVDLEIEPFIPNMLRDEYGLTNVGFKLTMHSLVIQGMHLNSALLGHCDIAIGSDELRPHLRALGDKGGLNFDRLEFWTQDQCREALQDQKTEAWHGTALSRLRYLVEHWESVVGGSVRS